MATNILIRTVAALLASATLVTASQAGADAGQKPASSFNHIGISVADQAKSIAFYQALFGFPEIKSPFPPGGPRWLAIGGGMELHIQAGRTAPIVLPRTAHMAFAVPSLDPLIAYLDAHAMPWMDIKGTPSTINRSRQDGVLQIFFQDPDGYWIEVNDALKAR